MKKWNKTAIFAAFAVLVCASAQALSQEELFFQAVKNRDVFTLRILIHQWADLNYRYANGKSALMYACEDSWYEGVVFLLGENADVELRDFHGKTALMYAVQSQYIMSVRLLIDNGANINAKDYDGKTALMYAIENKDVKSIDFLLRRGVDCSSTDMDGDNIAMYAAKYGMTHTLKKGLLQENQVVDWNQTNKEGVSPFAVVCMKGDFSAIKQLLKKAHVDVSASRIDGLPILIWLIANRKAPAIIKCIIGYCSPAEILLTTDDLGHDIKYWAEKQGYESVLALLDEIKEKGLW